MVKLLVVEDDADIAGLLQRGLTAEGYDVTVADNGRDALVQAGVSDYPLIILDLMLPLIDGLEVCRMLRQQGSRSLILMLTAKDGLGDKVGGLRAGADDFLTKPFAFEELLARLEALLRRRGERGLEPVVRFGDLAIEHASRTVKRGDRVIELTDTEFRLLDVLAGRAGRVVERSEILRAVWQTDADPLTNIVDVYIRRLRLKIDGPGEAPLIGTVRGIGYRLSNEAAETA